MVPRDFGKVVSVNVSLPRTVRWKGRIVSTGIFKEPVTSRVQVGARGLVGDGQADLTVHGGPTKAVYAYPSEHYSYWRDELTAMGLGWGMFGENLTTDGIFEEDVHVGDWLRVGTAVLVVTQPRFPCYKLGIRFGRKEAIEKFLRSGRSGFYLAVRESGEVAASDPISLIKRSLDKPTVAEVVQAALADGGADE